MSAVERQALAFGFGPRVARVIALAVEGLSDKAIAERLGEPSDRVVQKILWRAYQRLGVNRRRDVAEALNARPVMVERREWRASDSDALDREIREARAAAARVPKVRRHLDPEMVDARKKIMAYRLKRPVQARPTVSGRFRDFA